LSSPATMCPASATSMVWACGRSSSRWRTDSSLTMSDAEPRISMVGCVIDGTRVSKKAVPTSALTADAPPANRGSQCQCQRPSSRNRSFLRNPSGLAGRGRWGW